MRKIMSLIVFVFILALFSGAVSATSMLEISEVTVKVDGDTQSADENGGTIKVTPDSTLSLKIKVKNLYSSGTDGGKIENINVNALLESIDDGDDMEEEANDFDLTPGRDKTLTIEFKIPLRLETDGSWKLTLTAEGDDENSTTHTDQVDFDVDADKESYELRFMREELSPATVACDKQSRITVRLINTGENDEEPVELTIDAPDLEYNEVSEFDMAEDIDDDTNEYEFTDTINVGKIDAGTYPVSIRAVYHDGRKVLEDTLNLVAAGCAEEQPEQPTQPTQPVQPTQPTQPTQPVEQEIEVVSQPTVQPTVQTTTSYARPTAVVATPKTSYNKSWAEQNWLTIMLIVDALLIIIGAIVIAAVLKRRR